MKKNYTIDGFVDTAKKSVVTVVFDKINDGGRRIMPCTLNSELSNHNVPEVLEQREKESDHLVVWAVDKEAWRSFRIDTLVEWYEGQPETQT
jgi:hypothetical protein